MIQTRDERIKEIKGRRYGYKSAQPWNVERCAARVVYFTGKTVEQCSYDPGHGLGGLFCKQHAKNNPEVE